MSDALFCCQNGDCSTYVSYPADELRMAREVRICEGCYDSGDCDHLVWVEKEEYLSFYELPKFVTEEAAEIAKLKARYNEGEAVFLFAGWLTTRSEPVTMSSTHDAAIVAELCEEFIKEKGFPQPRQDWHKLQETNSDE
jgi:hypothetical protein